MDDWDEFSQAKRRQAIRRKREMLEEAAEARARQGEWEAKAKQVIQIAERLNVANLMKRFYDQVVRHDFPNSRLIITPPEPIVDPSLKTGGPSVPSYEVTIILQEWTVVDMDHISLWNDSGIRIVITPDNVHLYGWRDPTNGIYFGDWRRHVDLKPTSVGKLQSVFKALAIETLQHCAPDTYGSPPPPEEQSPPSLVTRFLRWLSS